jgi:lysophospholipase L1-like esterase
MHESAHGSIWLHIVLKAVVAWLCLSLLAAISVDVAKRLRSDDLPVELAGLVHHPAFAGREQEARAIFEDVYRAVRTTSTYDAFSGWHYGAFQSPTWTTDAHGYRQFPGKPTNAKRRVYLFGGSTLAGWGVQPEDSILAKVQALLPDVEVVSRAHGAYTSRQGLSGLLRLASERGDFSGDVIVFYDGYNDFWVGCSVGDPAAVTLFEEPLGRAFSIGRALKHRSPLQDFADPFWRPLQQLWALATGQGPAEIPIGSKCDAEPGRRNQITRQFTATWRMAKAVTEQFGGHFVGFFSPALHLSQNRGSYIPAPVRAFIDKRDAAFAGAQRETVAAVRAIGQSWARDLTTLFDADPQAPVFLDATHVTGKGADLAARAIADAVRPLLGSPAAAASADSDGPFLDCPASAVNDLGVGRPCQRNSECIGQQAITCLADAEPGGFPFCTTYCFGLNRDECGPSARCIKRGDKPGVCAPDACAKRLEVQPAPMVAIDKLCKVGQVNSFGVGKPCTAHADCASFTVARSCPVIFKPENPTFCSVLCSSDAECGPGAFCWAEATVEAGARVVVRSCVPEACKLAEAPTTAAP